MALTRQKATKARATPVSTGGSNSRPAARGAVADEDVLHPLLGPHRPDGSGKAGVRGTTSVAEDMSTPGYRARRVRDTRTTVEPVRAPEPRRVLGARSRSPSLVLLGGCGSGEAPPVPPPIERDAAQPTPTAVTVPADGVTLRSLGYLNGPVEQFTLPRTALVSAAVDQPNNVTAVLTSAPAGRRRGLPAPGAAGHRLHHHRRRPRRLGPDLRRARLDRQLHRERGDLGDPAATGLSP